MMQLDAEKAAWLTQKAEKMCRVTFQVPIGQLIVHVLV